MNRLSSLNCRDRNAACAADDPHAFYTRVWHALPDGIIAIDPQQRVITINQAAERLFGMAESAAIGADLAALGLADVVLDDDADQELLLALRSGAAVPVQVRVTPCAWPTAATPCHVLVVRDVSVPRALERDRLQAERLSAMAAMAGSLAHEIKNPLVPIHTFAHLLPTCYDDPEFRQEFSAVVVNEVEQLNTLVGQVLDLVRKPPSERVAVDLRDVWERLRLTFHAECDRQGIHLVATVPSDLPPVFGIADQLEQAMVNIMRNAITAMPAGGTLTVDITVDTECITCRVTDTGPGVPAEELSQIFEPFYTTKPDGHGLGLALTYQCMHAHGGTMRAACAPGCGLTIVLTLPALPRTKEAPPCR